MKPRDEWGPADEFVDGASKMAMVLLACLFLGVFGYWVGRGVTDKLAEIEAWNKADVRGFIGCEDGHFVMRNVIFAYMHFDQGRPLIDSDAVSCASKAGE